MKSFRLLFFAAGLLPSVISCSAWGAEPPAIPLPSPGGASLSAPSKPFPSDVVLEQGKTLYYNGDYLAALDKFMQVLRRDPQQAEARQYVSRVSDQIRNQKAASPQQLVRPANRVMEAPAAPAQAPQKGRPVQNRPKVPVSAVDEEVRQRVQKRQLLTLDLAAVPGIKVKVDSKIAQVEIPSALLFTEKTGGLKEEGIPILDRVAAWLKTFGSQPVVIHCYPEELEDASVNGSLFFHRYAQLYGFFVDERKLSAARFVTSEKDKKKNEAGPANEGDVNASRVIIASLGGGALPVDEMPAGQGGRWLEFSISSSRQELSPHNGDWVNVDLSALTHKGIRSWDFKISPLVKKTVPVFSLEGKTNLLKRISWDGRYQKSGSFVSPGSYVCRLTATNADGTTKSQEILIKVRKGAGQEEPPALSQKVRRPAAERPKPKSTAKSNVAAVPAAVSPAAPQPKPGGLSQVAAALPQVVVPPRQMVDGKILPPAPEAVQKPAVQPPAPAPVVPPPPVEKPVEKAAEEPVEEKAVAEPAEPVESAESPESPEAAEPEESDDSTHAIWKQVIQFDLNESDLKPTLKASLERIGKTLEVYPLQKVRILGFAEAGESNAANLARERADAIRQILVNEYQVDARRVLVAGGKVGGAGHRKVEISITN
jgi:outer membrane protein OmpA-like peptidoglycan-associated protein